MKPKKIRTEIYSVPNHAVTWFLYGDRDSVSDEEIEVYKDFLEENELRAVDAIPSMFDEFARCDITDKYTEVIGMLFLVLRE